MKMITRFCIVLALWVGSQTASAQMIVAHRGASHDAPENTVSAFEEAWRQQADGIEGDFYLTADRQIVCIHDKDTKRTGGKKLSVAGSTLAQLRQLEYGAWKSKKFAGEPLPTFEDVWKTVPADKLFVVELKVGPGIVQPLADELRRLHVPLQQVLIIAFDQTTIAKCKQVLPDVRAHWLTGYKQNAITGSWSPSAAKVAQILQESGADGLGTQGRREVVDGRFINTLKAAGMQEFHVWTIDEPEDAQFFQGLGAVGITTNRPAFIRKYLQ